MKIILGVIGSLFLVLVVGFGLDYAGYISYNFFAPRYEATRFNTFKESQAYNEGMVRHLYDLQRQYAGADAEGKTSLRALTIHEFEVYDISRLPSDLQVFYHSISGV